MPIKYSWSEWDWPTSDDEVPINIPEFCQSMADKMEKLLDAEYQRVLKTTTEQFEAAADLVVNDITENCDLVRVGKMIEFQWLTEDGPRVLAEWHHDDRSKRQGPLRPKGRTMKDYNIWMR